jgi:hypothetical protein
MPDTTTKNVNQNSIYPTRDSLQEVIDEGVSQLPITSKNQLIGLLMTYQNTLVNLMMRGT